MHTFLKCQSNITIIIAGVHLSLQSHRTLGLEETTECHLVQTSAQVQPPEAHCSGQATQGSHNHQPIDSSDGMASVLDVHRIMQYSELEGIHKDQSPTSGSTQGYLKIKLYV